MAVGELGRVAVGSAMQLESPNKTSGTRYQVRVIGYLPGRSLVVTNPIIDGKYQIIRESVLFNVRMLTGGDVVAFQAKVLQVSLKPYPHLHLEYPTEVESKNVRNASRVNVQVPAKVINLSGDESNRIVVDASLNDLSHTGAGIVTQSKPVAFEGDIVNLIFEFELMASKENININADVRRVHSMGANTDGQESFFHGVQFRSCNRLQLVTLHAWTLERRTADVI